MHSSLGFSSQYAYDSGALLFDKLDRNAFEEAQQRDDTATRSFSNVPIMNSQGKCLFVDELSGDSRANLTPIQIGDCGSSSSSSKTEGQGWDIITSGEHDDRDDRILIVSTLTQACFNADPRRPEGSQVNLFSCGGRADGGGEVTDSQLMATDGSPARFRLSPDNGDGYCLTAGGEAVDIERCDENADEQWFSLGGDGSSTTTAAAAPAPTATAATPTSGGAAPAMAGVDTATASPTAEPSSAAAAAASSGTPAATATGASSSADADSTAAVSRAGGNLIPTAVAEAQEFDDTATRPVQGVHIRSPDGRCLSVDATAGDFRENIIPVDMATCSADEAGQKFDIVTAGRHDDATLGEALVVSALTNGCISFDARRAEGDTVTVFSCGGRADGGGQTDTAQLYPFKKGDDSVTLEPTSGNGEVCLVSGSTRLESGSCDGSETFDLVQNI
ncbi:Ricin-type beta-trefoil lectin domain [Geosmithia morbida]|uniref:Ricin-type beta-trefoil lectin domain n=1 Tax=Geosmithia morbida TaxID=1094350 RepID=A0A9P5CXW0_9HYPO|nr:Ricin-type beta-trefoil lectin domain [Geosmithia morbida]KAF4119718.1 Ricin-type beta-trefoil lectin domain [Geosmithia morbida]